MFNLQWCKFDTPKRNTPFYIDIIFYHMDNMSAWKETNNYIKVMDKNYYGQKNLHT